MAEENKRTGILVILDGFGINPNSENNSIAQAHLPTWSYLNQNYPHSEVEASEHFVGLPPGFMGNSEVGHLNIGAGRVVYQDFSLISKSILDRSFFVNPAFSSVLDSVLTHQSALHLVGLVSDGGVHSHESHLFALLELAKQKGIKKLWVHFIADGRDTPPQSAKSYLNILENKIKEIGVGQVATISGRFYSMDRDKRWERTQIAYEALVLGKSKERFSSARTAIETAYQQNIWDEFLMPTVSQNYAGMNPQDGVLFFNFRADRMRQLVKAISGNAQAQLPLPNLNPPPLSIACMSRYEASLPFPVAYEKARIQNTLGEYVSRLGWHQLRIAETEKYAHVTYFFNGGEEAPFPNEKRILIPSPKEVKTYDLKPEMSAVKLTDSLLAELKQNAYQFVVVNFANPDMVGHTGNLKAAIQAVETVDACLARIYEWVKNNNAFCLISADHGNCEKMVDDDGIPLTSHTLLPVPFLVVDPQRPHQFKAENGKLCDIAPSLLFLWGLPKPVEMTGESLVKPQG